MFHDALVVLLQLPRNAPPTIALCGESVRCSGYVLTTKAGLGGSFNASADIGVCGDSLWELQNTLRKSRFVLELLERSRFAGVQQVVADCLFWNVQPLTTQRTVARVACVEAGTVFGRVVHLLNYLS